MRLSWLLGLLSLACAKAGICDQTKTVEMDADGGVYGCVTSDTCPRDSLPICLDTDFPQITCVACEAEQCLRITPVECDG